MDRVGTGIVSYATHSPVVQDGYDIFAKKLVRYSNDIAFHNRLSGRSIFILIGVVSFLNYTNVWYRHTGEGGYEEKKHVKTHLIFRIIGFDQHENRNITFHFRALSRLGELQSKTVERIAQKPSHLYPQIFVQDTRRGHTVEGELLTLTCKIVYQDKVRIRWYFLKDTWQELYTEENTGAEFDSLDFSTHNTTSEYTTEGKASKSGFYRCQTKTFLRTFWEEIWVPVYGINDTVIEFDSESGNFDRKKKHVKVLINAHPRPRIQWLDNNGEIIPTSLISTEYTATSGRNNYMTVLNFEEVNLDIAGKYTVLARNQHKNANFTITVNVSGTPTSSMNVEKLDEENMTSVIKCTSFGYPEPEIRWYFQTCSMLETCVDVSKVNENNYKEIQELRRERQGLETISYVSIGLSDPGILRCRSKNSQGENFTDEPIIYVRDKFDFFPKHAQQSEEEDVKVIELIDDEKLTMIGAVSTYHYVAEIDWMFFVKWERPFFAKGDQSYIIADYYKIYDYKLLLSFISVLDVDVEYDANPTLNEYQNYYCQVLSNDGHNRPLEIEAIRRKSDTLVIKKTNMMNHSVEVNIGDKWNFQCQAEGFPTPVIQWLKNNQAIQESKKIKTFNYGQGLEISDIDFEDEGVYACHISNRFKTKSFKQTLAIRKNLLWIYIVSVVLALAVLMGATTLVLYIKIKKQNRLLTEYELTDLTYFEEGNLKNLNPTLGLEGQADLLPYDRKWEIPFDKIKLGKQLGSGAFGVVHKAEIFDYFVDERQKSVAIKTTDPSSESIQNLVSELKIISHLGKHVNIVNLLGACTRNMIKKQLYIVVEYCEFGNLQDYIRKWSKNFVDQKNYKSDEFDWTIVDNNTKRDYIKVNPTENTHKSIYTKDFLIWAFQVCRGMEYLGSRRIVHGDLAARNILLCDDGIVKISDFGLSKKMYQQSNYVRKGEGPLPVKWMAAESIERGLFSIQSDVWSFGIVLWEFFSLGGTPYPGMTIDEGFHKRLIGGYRMEAPQTATASIYSTMLDCWNLDPLLRPPFASLTEKIGIMLDDATKNYYIDMNNGYVLMNYGCADQEDYFTMFSPPTFENVVCAENLSDC